ncbi:MAG: hypothetical protein EA427_06335 [Spirochaetaceae bacterium]|nr:MAG: hypothetical protein EA427_06335 [Spirochaetaceae bacterium]
MEKRKKSAQSVLPGYTVIMSMKENTVFERLSAELTREERDRLLESVRRGIEEQLAPVSCHEETVPPAIEVQIRTLSFLARMSIFFRQLFTGMSQEDLILRRTLAAMRNQLQKTSVSGVEPRRLLFTEQFALALENLRHSQIAVAPALELVSSRRPELVFRLVAAECPEINRDLIRHTSSSYVEEQEERNERILRSTLTRYVEERLQEVSTENSVRIRRALAQVDQLVALAQFPFSSMISSFSGDPESGGRYCPFDYLAHSLERLASELSRLAEPLEQNALETIVLVACRPENYGTQDLFQAALEASFAVLADSIRALRDFSRQYPLLSLVRVIREDPWWMPQAPEKTGHDWLSIYRSTVGERISAEVLRVSLHRQLREKIRVLEEILEGPLLPFEGLPGDVKSFHTAMILWSFVESFRRNTLTPLRLILNGAEFYKSSNRAQYNDAFNDYEQIPLELQALRNLIVPEGDWGRILHGGEPSGEASGETPEGRPAMIARVEEELLRLATGTRITLETLVNVLGGILYARPGSSYDSIANYGQIGGRRNAELIDEIKQVHAGLQQIGTIISEVDVLEKRARENGILLRASS